MVIVLAKFGFSLILLWTNSLGFSVGDLLRFIPSWAGDKEHCKNYRGINQTEAARDHLEVFDTPVFDDACS